MPIINTQDIPVTQSDMMNNDHKEFVESLNKLMELVAILNNDKCIDTALEQLLTHTEEHFAKEESLMIQANFPPYPVHKNEHERVLKILREAINHWHLNRDRESLQPLLQELLPEWFMQHVSTMDKITAQFIQQAENQ